MPSVTLWNDRQIMITILSVSHWIIIGSMAYSVCDKQFIIIPPYNSPVRHGWRAHDDQGYEDNTRITQYRDTGQFGSLIWRYHKNIQRCTVVLMDKANACSCDWDTQWAFWRRFLKPSSGCQPRFRFVSAQKCLAVRRSNIENACITDSSKILRSVSKCTF